MKSLLVVISVFSLFLTSSSHYVWLTTDNIESTEVQPQNTTLQLSELAGVPGPEAFIRPLVDLTVIHLQAVELPEMVKLPFTLEGSKTSSELVASLELQNYSTIPTPYIIETYVDYGLFGDGLLQYYSNNVKINENKDWSSIGGLATNLFEITLRDLFTEEEGRKWSEGDDLDSSHFNGSNKGDQCSYGQKSTESGEACVMAVVKFKGKQLQTAMNVTTYDGDTGLAYKTAECEAGGIVMLAVPTNADGSYKRVYAKVQYKEDVVDQEYAYIDYWASTMGEFKR